MTSGPLQKIWLAAGEYSDDLKTQKLSEEMASLKSVHVQNFRKDAIHPPKLLNKICTMHYAAYSWMVYFQSY